MQNATGSGTSHLDVYKTLVRLCWQPSFRWGRFDRVPVPSDSLYIFTRIATGFDGYLIALNLGPHATTGNLRSSRSFAIPAEADIVCTTANFENHYRKSEFKVGSKVNLESVHLQPGEGAIFRWANTDTSYKA